jgi:hypothetical protein
MDDAIGGIFVAARNVVREGKSNRWRLAGAIVVQGHPESRTDG